VALDRGLPENRDLVEAYRVSAAPLPLILVVAGNGVVAGGALLADATPEALARLVPTPKKAEMLLHLTGQIPVFVVFSRASMAGQGPAFEACSEAVRTLDHKAATVVVDLDDEAEAAFAAEMNVAADAPAPVVVVYNAKAQKTGSFRGAVTAAQLVAAARKRASCCPGGSC
jgi:hypothetical protein